MPLVAHILPADTRVAARLALVADLTAGGACHAGRSDPCRLWESLEELLQRRIFGWRGFERCGLCPAGLRRSTRLSSAPGGPGDSPEGESRTRRKTSVVSAYLYPLSKAPEESRVPTPAWVG